jgi:hypothetical protein
MKTKQTVSEWAPTELLLPNLDRLEEISRQERQLELSINKPDDSRAGRLARLLSIAGVKLASTMEPQA